MHYVTMKNGRLGAVIENYLIDLDVASVALGLAFVRWPPKCTG
jgi:hypothetical protein